MGFGNFRTKIPVEPIYDLYVEFTKGVLCAANYYEKKEGSKLHNINGLAASVNTTNNPTSLGFCERDKNGVTIGIFPRLISAYVTQSMTQKFLRIFEDYKIPGKYFNAKEVAFLTGLEEACHAQQMLAGRFKKEYNATQDVGKETYTNAECEKEVEEISQEVTNELQLGADIPDVEPVVNQSEGRLNPRERAEKRKQEKNRKKKR